ncbi:MAG TPA: serine protease, partial [Vicinamibacterales bacterium]|nr:serine protease [Vicinamibacterales bacterium]
MSSRRASRLRRIALGAALLAGCGDDADGFGPPTLHDVAGASPAIQRAAQAIVRVRGARGAGTGSFISADGLLLTNNHVLGNRTCPIEGCWFDVTFDHQRGQPPQEPQTVFGVPLHVDVGLDMAILQIYTEAPASDANRLATPNYLSFVPYEAVDLIGKHVTVVGHPEARLKKWASGVVIDVSGVWFESTVFILPGDSGSPLLDDEGKLIGLMHRSAEAADLLTSSGYLTSSLGTASAPLIAAMDAPLPASMISIAADAAPDDIVENNAVYLNGRAQSVPVQGVATSVISLLAQACDQGLARTDYLSPEDLTSAITPCDDAQFWIDCRKDVDPVAYGVVCPDSDLSGWAARFQAMNQRQRALNG